MIGKLVIVATNKYYKCIENSIIIAIKSVRSPLCHFSINLTVKLLFLRKINYCKFTLF